MLDHEKLDGSQAMSADHGGEALEAVMNIPKNTSFRHPGRGAADQRADSSARLDMAICVAVAAALLPLLASAADSWVPGARRHDREDSLYLTLGKDPAFGSVGAIQRRAAHIGSGVLVAPNWVLTDAHVVSTRASGHTEILPAAELVVVLDDLRVSVDMMAIHPGYWPDTVASSADPLVRKGVDVALLRLTSPVQQIQPAPMLASDPKPPVPVTFVGYGTSGTAQSIVSAPVPAGTKRAGTNVVDQIGGKVAGREIPPFLLVADFDSPDVFELNRTGDATPTDLEYLPVGGDSGGGVFVRVDGAWHLAGLFATATISDNDGDKRRGIYGSVVYATSIPAIRSWIQLVQSKTR